MGTAPDFGLRGGYLLGGGSPRDLPAEGEAAASLVRVWEPLP